MQENEMTFETAMSRLSQITQQMEDPQLALGELGALYKEGKQLYTFCKEKLDAAEKEIVTLA